MPFFFLCVVSPQSLPTARPFNCSPSPINPPPTVGPFPPSPPLRVDPCPVALRPYDQLAVMGPFLLALTAATPSYRGFLADTDVRWNQISLSVDDRCPPLPIPSAPSPHRSVSPPPGARRDRCGRPLIPASHSKAFFWASHFPSSLSAHHLRLKSGGLRSQMRGIFWTVIRRLRYVCFAIG